MKSSFVLLAVFAVFGVIAPAPAGEHRLGELLVVEAWALTTPRGARNGAAYVTIKNRGRHAVPLTAVSSPAAARAALHSHTMEAGVMNMHPVAAIDVPAGAVLAMKTGGLHIMLMGLVAPLVDGGKFPLTLTFGPAGALTLEVTAIKPSPHHGRKQGKVSADGHAVGDFRKVPGAGRSNCSTRRGASKKDQ